MGQRIEEFEGYYQNGDEEDAFFVGAPFYPNESYYPGLDQYKGRTIDLITLCNDKVKILFREEREEEEEIDDKRFVRKSRVQETITVHIPLQYYEYYTTVEKKGVTIGVLVERPTLEAGEEYWKDEKKR